MTTTTKTNPCDTEQRHQDVTIVLSNDVLAGLRSQVAFRTVGDVQDLVADAITSYVQLGQLRANGATIFARQGEDGKTARLHFPFDPAPLAAAEAEG